MLKTSTYTDRKLLFVSIVMLLLLPHTVLGFFSNHSKNSDGTYGENPVHRCETTIEGYHIVIELHRTHPFLSEHNKHIKITSPNGILVMSETFVNPGGLTSMYFFDEDNHLIIIDGMADGISINKESGEAIRKHFVDYVKRIETDSIGRTMFGSRGYAYYNNEEIAKLTKKQNKQK